MLHLHWPELANWEDKEDYLLIDLHHVPLVRFKTQNAENPPFW
jgi:hypothetical protein